MAITSRVPINYFIHFPVQIQLSFRNLLSNQSRRVAVSCVELCCMIVFMKTFKYDEAGHINDTFYNVLDI